MRRGRRHHGAGSGADERLLDRIDRRLFWVGWLANGAGAAFVVAAIAFVIPIFIDAPDRDGVGDHNLPWLAAYFVLAGVGCTVASRRDTRIALAWIAEGREPTVPEHCRTLELAMRQAVIALIAWVLAGALGLLINLEYSVGFAVVGAVAAWLAGEMTAAIQYLLAERVLRPITALALAVRRPAGSTAPGIRHRLQFAWSLGTGVPVIGATAIGVVGVTKDGVETEYLAAAMVFLGCAALLIGLFATVIAARAISDPVRSVREALDRVAAGDLEVEVSIDDASEVGLLQAGFNRMAEGLREREHLRDMFGRQVGREVAQAALRDGARLGGEEREVGALFVDLAGSTSMALAMPPTEVVRLLNRFFRVVIEVVEEEGGLVNKFEGDAALCVFGAPATSADPAGDALRTGRRLAGCLEREVPEIGFGIGVSAGRAVAGNVGSEARFEYTVIGDPVNEAARLCDLAKERGEPVVASDAALARASEREADMWTVTDRTVLRGRLEATGVALPQGGTDGDRTGGAQREARSRS